MYVLRWLDIAPALVYSGRASAAVTRVCNGILTISYVERGEITRLHVRPAIIIDGGEQPAHPLKPMIKENLVRTLALVRYCRSYPHVRAVRRRDKLILIISRWERAIRERTRPL